MGNMKTQVSEILEVTAVMPPDGEYEGTWGGYVVRFHAHDKAYQAKTRDGIRTPSAPVIVTVKDGKCEIELRKATP
jgi:hypothetical protein